MVDITLTAQKTLPCRIYLPLVVRQWRLPWTTLSATPTTTTTPSATRSATPTRTANTTATATATVMTTPTATATLLPPGAVTLATLGDSLTEGDGDNFELGGFPGRLLPLLQGRRPASTVTNLGHSGWDSEMLINGNGGVPSQLNQAVTLLNQAAAAGQAPMAMVWIGSNDLWYLYSNEGETPPGEEQQDVQHFTGNIDTILRTLRGAGAAVFIALLDDQSKRPVMADPAIRMAILPGISATEVISMSLQVTRYNQAIAGMAAQHGASTVDFYHTTIFTDTATLNEDGIHPNGAGYDLITQIWFSAMSPLLP
ncbi:MAG: SGNH/GDSL hydrolase family protein [Chloroflexi bacterium]|nr:SGNH/GDSL hydrolase family protein [Chloroflexota bacterium]